MEEIDTDHSNGSPLLRTVDLCRYYRRGDYQVKALDGVSVQVREREFVALVGASGSGKSTLLALMAGLDSATSGRVEFEGTALNSLSRKQLAAYRASKVGMIFQSFNLLSHRTALQNVELALYFNEVSPDERTERARVTLESLGLKDRLDHKPADLSGGEQQRVAIARALVKKPKVLFADEPTGNLDYDHSRQIADLLVELNGQGTTIVMVTHDRELAERAAGRVIRLVYGRIDRGGDR